MKSHFTTFLILGGILLVLPLTVFLVHQQQDIRQRAQISSQPTKTAQSPPVRTSAAAQPFLYGVFEDANHAPAPQSFLSDVKAHNMDTVVFTNNATFDYPQSNRTSDESYLTAADGLGMHIIFAPHWELTRDWYGQPEDITTIRNRVYPIVDKLKNHRSLLAYNILDDADHVYKNKLAQVTQSFSERDPTIEGLPMLIQGHEDVYTNRPTDVLITYVYPVLRPYPYCDFSSSAGDGLSYLQRLRVWTSLANGKPIWLVGQVHGSSPIYDPKASWDQLRTPNNAELRIQHWLAIGEGFKGVFWFIYGTQQWWTGLADNPTLYAEAANLGVRTSPFRNLLGQLTKTNDMFTITGGGNPYVSTLHHPDGRNFAVAVNQTCSSQTVSVNSSLNGKLRDLETDQTYNLGQSISLQAGDGKIFELVTGNPPPTVTPTSTFLPEDIDRNGCVGILDFNAWFQAVKGTPQPNTFPDVNKDGIVDILDFNLWFRAMKNLPPDKLC